MIIDTGHHDFLVTDGTSALLGRSPGHLGLFLAHAGSSSLGRERLISATPQAEHTFTSILLGRSVLQAEYLASFVQESSHGEKGGVSQSPSNLCECGINPLTEESQFLLLARSL